MPVKVVHTCRYASTAMARYLHPALLGSPAGHTTRQRAVVLGASTVLLTSYNVYTLFLQPPHDSACHLVSTEHKIASRWYCTEYKAMAWTGVLSRCGWAFGRRFVATWFPAGAFRLHGRDQSTGPVAVVPTWRGCGVFRPGEGLVDNTCLAETTGVQ